MTTSVYPKYSHSVHHFSVAGSLYTTGWIGAHGLFIQPDGGNSRTFTSKSTYDWMLCALVDAAECLYRRQQRTIWIAQVFTPAPALKPSVSVAACEKESKTVKKTKLSKAQSAALEWLGDGGIIRNDGNYLNFYENDGTVMSYKFRIARSTFNWLERHGFIQEIDRPAWRGRHDAIWVSWWNISDVGWDVIEPSAAIGKPETVSEVETKTAKGIKPMACEGCGMGLVAREKGDTWSMEHTLYTSHTSNRKLCGNCIAEEAERIGNPLPKSLREINDERAKNSTKSNAQPSADARREQKVAVDTKPRKSEGHWYNVETAAEMSEAFVRFTVQYSGEPNIIKLHTKHLTEIGSTQAVPYTRDDSIPRGKVWMGYSRDVTLQDQADLFDKVHPK